MVVLQHVTTKEHAQTIRQSGLEVTHGEAGRGVYFFNSKSKSMLDYYLNNTPQPAVITVRIDEPILDLTAPEIKQKLKDFAKKYYTDLAARMGETFIMPRIDDSAIYKTPYVVESFVYLFYPQYEVYITRHFGHGVPDSKQYIVRNPRLIKLISVK